MSPRAKRSHTAQQHATGDNNVAHYTGGICVAELTERPRSTYSSTDTTEEGRTKQTLRDRPSSRPLRPGIPETSQRFPTPACQWKTGGWSVPRSSKYPGAHKHNHCSEKRPSSPKPIVGASETRAPPGRVPGDHVFGSPLSSLLHSSSVSSPESTILTFFEGAPLWEPTDSTFVTTSMPSITFPKTTCRPSSQEVFTVVRKN